MIEWIVRIMIAGFIILAMFCVSAIIYSKGWELGFKDGKTEAMKQIELSNGVTNMDSSIAKLKQMPSDSITIAVFNLYATDQEREMVKQFAMWIKKIKEVR